MNQSFTICWDCAKATGFCSWSDELIPVKGWTAEPIRKRLSESHYADTYLVTECPEFERDAFNFGLRRLKDDTVRNDS